MMVSAGLIARPLEAQRRDSVKVIRWPRVAVGAGAVVLLSGVDALVSRSLEHADGATLSAAHLLDHGGDAYGMVSVVGGLAAVGALSHDRAIWRLAVRTAESVALSGLFVQSTKHVVGRLRPNQDSDLDGYDFRPGGGDPSFPSGHTAVAFALATSLGDAVPNSWARAGLFLVAGGTAWARLTEERHWLSDVAAGAAVGWLAAQTVDGRIRVLGFRAPRLHVVEGGVGLGWSLHVPGD